MTRGPATQGHGGNPRETWGFNAVLEIHRTRVTVVNDPDVEWFCWSPRTETISLQPAFGATFKCGTVALALAHRALGHWGMSVRQEIEARELTARWLINDRSVRRGAALVPTIGVLGAARQLGVTPHVLQVRLQPVPVPDQPRHLPGVQCECGAIPSVQPLADGP